MPQVNYTSIQLYRSGTTGNTPNASLMQNGELAINYADGKLFYKDGAGTVRTVVTPDGSVTTAKIADANVTAAKLASGAAVSNIDTGGITGALLASGAVTTAKIADANVTAAKLSIGAAVSNIGAGGITSNELAGNAVTTAKIANANVTAAKLDGAQSGAAPIYAARAWVNFNGAGTVAIRASGNVSSITDHGYGDYTVNFATAMPDTNYSAVVTAGGGGTAASGNAFVGWAAIYATSSVRIGVSDNNTDSNSDSVNTNVTIFR